MTSQPSEADRSPRPNETHRIQLTGEKQTLLITLYAKALDSRSKSSILHDTKADEMVRTIDYDFSKLARPGNGTVLVVRARQLDQWVREFLASTQGSVGRPEPRLRA